MAQLLHMPPPAPRCAECSHQFTLDEHQYGYSKGDGQKHVLCWSCIQKVLRYFGGQPTA